MEDPLTATRVVTEPQLEALAERLAAFDEVLDDTDKVALLAVFELAGEALAARIDAKSEVQGFAQGAFDVGLQVGVPDTLPGLGDGLLDSVAQKGKGGGKHGGNTSNQYLRIRMIDVIVTGSVV